MAPDGPNDVVGDAAAAHVAFEVARGRMQELVRKSGDRELQTACMEFDASVTRLLEARQRLAWGLAPMAAEIQRREGS